MSRNTAITDSGVKCIAGAKDSTICCNTQMFLPGKEICLKAEGNFCEERSLSSDLGER